jgi:hypothetical protein
VTDTPRDLDAELDRLRARERLIAQLDELEIIGRPRDEMLAEPERALAVIRSVLDRAQTSGKRIKSPAALIISRWKQPALVSLDARRRDAERAAVLADPLGPEHEAGPPDLDALEQAWSLDTSSLTTGLLKLMAAAYTRHGGLYDGLRHNAEIRARARGFR